MHSYKSDFPNQVHQMNISISKRFHLLKDNTIKYQEKKFDINWGNYTKTKKRHLVNFLIRDHFSNCFYAEIHSIDNLPSTIEFLYNAWRRKSDFEFCGFPETLILGKKITDDCPEILQLTKRIKSFNIQPAENGFDTGIRSVRDWENCIKHNLGYANYNSLNDFQKLNSSFCRYYNLNNTGKTEPNLKKWATNIKSVIVENDKKRFYNLFKI